MQPVTRRRIFVWGAISAVIVVLIVLAFLPRPVAVDSEVVRRSTLEVTLDHEGETRVRQRYVVSAPVSGQVLRIELEPGDTVLQGKTVVATFRPSIPVPLDARSRAEAEAQLRAARSRLVAGQAEQKRASVAAELSERQLERTRSLRQAGAVSQEALDAAEAEARSSQDALTAAGAAAITAQHELQAAQAVLTAETSAAAGHGAALLVRAPVTGVVLRRLHESQAVVPAGQPLLELANRTDLEIASDYLTSDAVKIRAGMPVLIDQWGGGEPLKGRVRRVDPAGFTKVSALGVEEQRVWVVVELEDPYGTWATLGDAFRVQTRIVIWHDSRVLQVPTSALFRESDQWQAFVVKHGRAHRQPVIIGHRNALAAEVRSGLSVGERVIVHPSDQVEEGVRVTER
jgi:HlyD family secretion protein